MYEIDVNKCIWIIAATEGRIRKGWAIMRESLAKARLIAQGDQHCISLGEKDTRGGVTEFKAKKEMSRTKCKSTIKVSNEGLDGNKIITSEKYIIHEG